MRPSPRLLFFFFQVPCSILLTNFVFGIKTEPPPDEEEEVPIKKPSTVAPVPQTAHHHEGTGANGDSEAAAVPAVVPN